MEGLIEALLLSTAVFPLLRLCAYRGFRQRLTALSSITKLLVVGIIVYLLFLALLVFFAPLLLRLVFIVACLISLCLFWYARPAYGRKRGLPPGSLALFPSGQWNDAQYHIKNFRRYGPIYKASDLHRPAVYILGIERTRKLLQEHGDSLITPAFALNRFIPGGLLRFADPERHGWARPIFQNSFAPHIVRDAEPFVAGVIHSEFARMAQDSHRSGNGIHPKMYVWTMMQLALARVFFGIVSGTAESAQFENGLKIIELRRASRTADASVKRALDEMMTLIQNQVQSEPETRSFASELRRVHPDGFQDRFFVFNLIYIYQIGRRDLTGLLNWIFKMLCDHPEWADRLRTTGQDTDLATRIVRETLRLEQSEYIIRQTTRDIHFQNFLIPKGWFMRMCIRESHHLSTAFENPGCFNPDRFSARRYTHSEYMPFGAYNKSCLGEHLTLTVARLFLKQLVHNFEWRVVQDGPQEFSGFHWEPSSRWRVICTHNNQVLNKNHDYNI